MEKIGIFFGGKSCEHEVSVITAITAIAELEDKYDLVPVYMCEKGWYTGELLKKIETYKEFDDRKHTKVFLHGKELVSKGFLGTLRKVTDIDVAIICAHGGLGEGGGLAGLFEMSGIPYSSCGLLESAICLDKEYFKTIAKDKGYRVVPGTVLKKEEFCKCNNLARIIKKFGKDLIVKPVDLGSSIGVCSVCGEEELKTALEVAFCYSSRAIIEKKIMPLVEYNCAACTVGKEIIVSAIEKPIRSGEVLSYADKYLCGRKKGEDNLASTEISYGLANKIRKTTLKLYSDFNLSGVVRVDYIYNEEKNELYVNEVNTVPGSLSSNLFDKCGIEYEILADALIENAKAKHEEKSKYFNRFSSELLSGEYKVIKS